MVQTIKRTLSYSWLPLIFLLQACFDLNRCKEEHVFVPLSDPYRNWFGSVAGANSTFNATARSSSGLSESMTINRFQHQEPTLNPNRNRCTYEIGESVSLNYSSSLYGNEVNVKLLQQGVGETPILRIRTNSRLVTTQDITQMQFQFGRATSFPITYTRYIENQPPPQETQTNTFPEVSIEDSLVVGATIYRNVYKVSNLYLKIEGNSFSLTDFYIDKDFGLVQYVQKDGTVWQIQY